MGCAVSLPAVDGDASPLGKGTAHWASPAKPGTTTSTFTILATPFAATAAAVPKEEEAEEEGQRATTAAARAPHTPPPPPPPPGARRARDVYKFGRVLGSGGFSVVREARRRSDGVLFAAKVLPLPPPEEDRAGHTGHHGHHHPAAAPSLLLPSAESACVEAGDVEGAASAAAAAAAAAAATVAADPPAGSTRDEVLREVGLQASLAHPHLLRLVDWFVAPDHAVLVTELAPGGALLDALLSRAEQRGADHAGFDEDSARSVAAGLLSGLAALHAAGIAHRDVKLDNVLLGAPDDFSTVKLADFGLAASAADGGGDGREAVTPRPHTRTTTADEGGAGAPAAFPHHHHHHATAALKKLNTLCGTPEYVAPEVLSGRGYDGAAADCWSAGVCLFILLCGYAPFGGPDEAAVLSAVRAAGRPGGAGPDFGDHAWDAVSGPARDLVGRLLCPDPGARMTAAEALCHPWLRPAVEAEERAARAAAAAAHWRPAALAAVAQRRLAALAAERKAALAAAMGASGGDETLLATRASAPLPVDG